MISDAPLTIGLAVAAGVIAQVVARHASIPGIVVLLAAGILLGPDGLGLVQPSALGSALSILVGFAVAVILFEGGMNLDVQRIRAESRAIRRLVTLGAGITAAGGALAVNVFLGWEWRLAVLFGTLVIVTGPTVVGPLVRRLRLKEPVGTILGAEGVLIDPVGAIIAVVALEVLFGEAVAIRAGLGTALVGLGAGVLMGAVVGGTIILALRPRHLIPSGLENILVLSFVMAGFQVAEFMRPESGLTTVVVAGLLVGNFSTRVSRELLDFKEQLTVLLVGMLFVLLAAQVRVGDVRALGWAGIAAVASLMLIVRPLQVWICARGSALTLREKTFLAAMAPRGIVAAAVASAFSEHLATQGVPEATALQALVFLVIAATVVVYGLLGPPLASALELRHAARNGFAILGAHPIALELARLFTSDGQEVRLVDSNPERVAEARARGFDAWQGYGLRQEAMDRLDPNSRYGCIALTPNEEVNLLFVKAVRDSTRVPRLWVGLRRDSDALTIGNVHAAGARVLFGRPLALDAWISWLRSGSARLDRRVRSGTPVGGPPLHRSTSLMVLGLRRRGRFVPYDDETTFATGDEIAVLIDLGRTEEAEAALAAQGFAAPPALSVEARA